MPPHYLGIKMLTAERLDEEIYALPGACDNPEHPCFNKWNEEALDERDKLLSKALESVQSLEEDIVKYEATEEGAKESLRQLLIYLAEVDERVRGGDMKGDDVAMVGFFSTLRNEIRATAFENGIKIEGYTFDRKAAAKQKRDKK